LLTPSTSERPFFRVAQGLSLLMGSPPALQMAFPATISNSVENRIGSAFGSVILVVPFLSAWKK